MSTLQACHCCGQIHEVPALSPTERARCSRCHTILRRPGDARRSASRTAAITLGALFLYFPAILLPVLQIERLGHRSSSSILGGILDLLHHGNLFVGGVVLLFSIVFPLAKLLLLLDLSLLGILGRRHQALSYHVVELAGKWSMMDVLLLAFLVMLVKLGDLVSFQFGPAVIAFTLCVALSLLASLCFDPHTIWERE